jgi:hypothetical protein
MPGEGDIADAVGSGVAAQGWPLTIDPAPSYPVSVIALGWQRDAAGAGAAQHPAVRRSETGDGRLPENRNRRFDA